MTSQAKLIAGDHKEAAAPQVSCRSWPQTGASPLLTPSRAGEDDAEVLTSAGQRYRASERRRQPHALRRSFNGPPIDRHRAGRERSVRRVAFTERHGATRL